MKVILKVLTHDLRSRMGVPHVRLCVSPGRAIPWGHLGIGRKET